MSKAIQNLQELDKISQNENSSDERDAQQWADYSEKKSCAIFKLINHIVEEYRYNSKKNIREKRNLNSEIIGVGRIQVRLYKCLFTQVVI